MALCPHCRLEYDEDNESQPCCGMCGHPLGCECTTRSGYTRRTDPLSHLFHRVCRDYGLDQLWDRGLRLASEGRDEEAIAVYNVAVRRYPHNYAIINDRGISKIAIKDYTGAIMDFTQAILLSPKCAELFYNRGNSKAKLKDYAGAIKDYTQALLFNPKNIGALHNRGKAKAEIKDYTGAIDDYTQALLLDPNNVGILNSRGIAKVANNDYMGAFKDYAQALLLDPKYTRTLYNRGIAKSKIKDYAGAIEDQDKDSLGVSSFSLTCDEILLWTHYASNHKGICIEVDADIDRSPDVSLETVKYRSHIPWLKQRNGLPLSATDILSTKIAKWKYEQEIRAFCNGKDLKYRVGIITRVILGVRIEDTIRNLVEECVEKSRIAAAVLDFNTNKISV